MARGKTTGKDNGKSNLAPVVISFGVNEIGLEIIKKIESHNSIIDTGADGSYVDEIPNMLKSVCCNPKLDVVISAKLKADVNDAEALQLKEERDAEILTLPITQEVLKMKELVPEGYSLKAKEISKKVGDKNMKMGYLPNNLRGFYNPCTIDNSNLPSSVIAFSFENKGEIETGEKLFESKVVSVVYNQYTQRYDLHKWKVIYVLVKSTIDKEKNNQDFLNEKVFF